MKILNLQAENIKKLVAIDITPDGDTVVITGKNGAGKSSVLDSIYWALAGSAHIDSMPIRKGEEKGHIRLDLGKYVVERRFTEKNSYLTVTSKDGARYPSPQELLNDLTASITFDPLEFSRLNTKAQYEALRSLVKIDLDIEQLEADIESDFDTRTSVNREIKALESQIADVSGKIPETTPDQPVDVLSLNERINAERDNRRNRDAVAERVSNADKLISELKAQIEAMNSKLENYGDARQDLIIELSKITVMDDAQLDSLAKQLAESTAVNQAVSLKQDLNAKKSALKAKQDEALKLTTAIDDRKLQKSQAIAAADMPIPGLSLSDGVVFYNEIPFSQASSAQQLRVSTAIAMAMNPELRVIRIKDGSLLDDEGMAMLKGMASAQDFQIWIERVSDSDPVAIVIEEGEIQQMKGEKAA